MCGRCRERSRADIAVRGEPFDKLRTGFDKLTANGSDVELVKDFPFVLSLSKHGLLFQ